MTTTRWTMPAVGDSGRRWRSLEAAVVKGYIVYKGFVCLCLAAGRCVIRLTQAQPQRSSLRLDDGQSLRREGAVQPAQRLEHVVLRLDQCALLIPAIICHKLDRVRPMRTSSEHRQSTVQIACVQSTGNLPGIKPVFRGLRRVPEDVPKAVALHVLGPDKCL